MVEPPCVPGLGIVRGAVVPMFRVACTREDKRGGEAVKSGVRRTTTRCTRGRRELGFGHWSARPGAVSLLCCAGSAIALGDGRLAGERRLGNGAGSSF